MIAVRLRPALRMAVTGSPEYFAAHPEPQSPQDLAQHRCLNLHLRSSGGYYAWELEQKGREVRARVDGQLASDNVAMLKQAALDGLGLAFVMGDMVISELGDGSLVRGLDKWSASFAGYHLYYPSRRQPSAAFALVVEALRG